MTNLVIPGSQAVPGREYIYVEILEGEDFGDVFRNVTDCRDSAIRIPSSGGAINHLFRAKLKDETTFAAMSYKGDLNGWRNKFLESCRLQGRRMGVAAHRKILFSSGESVPFDEIEFEFVKE